MSLQLCKLQLVMTVPQALLMIVSVLTSRFGQKDGAMKIHGHLDPAQAAKVMATIKTIPKNAVNLPEVMT